MAPGTRRTLVLIEAGRHGPLPFLEQVPAALFSDQRIGFLCIDDGSAWAEQTAAWARRVGAAGLIVLRTPVRQGYGGCRKLGCRFALDSGYDQVLLMPGDGRVAPEEGLAVVRALEQGGADVALGVPSGAGLLGRVLGAAGQALTGRALSGAGFQAECAVYTAALLGRVFFEVNSNGPAFDLDLLLQASYIGARIIEVPLEHLARPITPGKLRSAVAAAAQLRMHRLGMVCSLKYQGTGGEVYTDKTQMVYSSHREAIRQVERLRPRTLLDLGSGPGFIARACEERGARVTGLDLRAPLAGTMSGFMRHDLERELPVDPFAYDVVLLLDVIEHLVSPEGFLIAVRNRGRALRPPESPTRFLLSTPNVAFAGIRLNLLLGRFAYAERGILDITHKRLFTRQTLLEALSDCGYRVEQVLPIGVPFEAVLDGLAGRVLGRLCDALARAWPTMFAFQFMVVCTPLPGIRQVLAGSTHHRTHGGCAPEPPA